MTAKTLPIVTSMLLACATKAPEPLAATDDALAVEMNTPATLALLDNDRGVEMPPVVALATAASHGMASVDADGVLTYMPAADYLGDDAVDYTVTNPDGKTATAHVAIHVACASCALGVPITLAWNANAPGDMVQGYRVFMGGSEDTSAMMKIDDIAIDKPGFDPMMPAVTYDAWTDLHLRIGDHVCFALTAYNGAGESGFSIPACADVSHEKMKLGL